MAKGWKVLLIVFGIVIVLGILANEYEEEQGTPTPTETPMGIPYTEEDAYAAMLSAYLGLEEQPGGNIKSSCLLASAILSYYIEDTQGSSIVTEPDIDRLVARLSIREDLARIPITIELLNSSVDYCIGILGGED